MLKVKEIPLNQYVSDPKAEMAKYGVETLVRIYRDMVVIREFETMLDRIKKEGVYEGIDEDAWSLRRLPPGNAEAQARGIVAFRIALSRVETKIKLSQNRDMEDRRRVIEKLEASSSQDAQATARWMKKVLP